MRISDWSSDVCSSDLGAAEGARLGDAAIGLELRHAAGARRLDLAIGRAGDGAADDFRGVGAGVQREGDQRIPVGALQELEALTQLDHELQLAEAVVEQEQDRKSTRLNSSH